MNMETKPAKQKQTPAEREERKRKVADWYKKNAAALAEFQAYAPRKPRT